MILRCLFISVALLAGSVAAATQPGVSFALSVQQYGADGRPVLLMTDTAQVAQGVPATGFLVSFSVDLEVVSVDTASVRFIVHVITLGPPSETHSRSFTVEPGLPAVIDSIAGKSSLYYRLVITPVAVVEIDLQSCPFNHHLKDVFTFDPSANMDIYYMPNSLADYHYSEVKGMLEYGYRQFKALTGFNLPGKYNIYLCPCPLPSVIWDRRYAIATDPTRASGWAIFSMNLNTIDAFVVNYLALLRNWGYAPPLISEGFANYGFVAEHDLRRIRRQKALPPLDSLVVTRNYLAADPYTADRYGASLVSFLVARNGVGVFRQLYESAHDLNLKEQLEARYAVPLGQLEAEWLRWIDTVSISANQVGQLADMAEAHFNYGQMRDYAAEMLSAATMRPDSMRALDILKRAQFYLGDYYEAVASQKELAARMPDSPLQWMTLAGYQMMAGEYEQARVGFTRSGQLDTTDQTPQFNLALCQLYSGDTADAVAALENLVTKPQGHSPRGEARVVLAELLSRSPVAGKRQESRRLYEEAVAAFMPQLQAQPAVAATHMWLGIASLGLARYDDAHTYLEAAQFLESRQFYLGMIHLWLGKLADVERKRDLALEYYREVLSGAAAAYHQKEARKYIDQPYRP